jgi:hypothetical protein
MAAMCKVRRNIEISISISLTNVPVRNVEPLDQAVVSRRADLRLARASAARKDDSPYHIQMTTQAKAEFEHCALCLLIQRPKGKLVLGAPPTRHTTRALPSVGERSTVRRLG